MVSGGEDSVVRVWDLKEKRVAMTWKAHASSVVSVRCCPDEDHVASGSIDGALFVHNLRNGKTVTKLQVRGEDANDALKMIQYSPHERSRIATCSDKGKVTVWESSRAKILASIAAHVAPCTAIAYSHVNASLLLSSSLDKTVKLHDIRARKTVSTINIGVGPATALDLASDGSTLAIGTSAGQVLVYDLQKSAQPLWTLAIPNHKNEIEHLTFQHPVSQDSAPTTKTTRSSAASSSATDNFFAPSPNINAGSTQQKAQEGSAPPSCSTSSMDLFSPVRSFDGAAATISDSITSGIAPTQLQLMQHDELETGDDFAHPFNHPFSQPSTSSSATNVGMQMFSPIQQASQATSDMTAPSGAPLSLLSPAPPTPSSYRYNPSRLSSNLFSPVAGGTQPQTSTPSKSSSSFALNFAPSANELSPIPISSLGSYNDALPLLSPRLSSSSLPKLRDGSTTPRGSSLNLLGSPLTSSTPGMLPNPLLGSSSGSPSSLFERTQRPLPASPSAPRITVEGAAASASAAAPVAPMSDDSLASHDGIQWQLVHNVLGDMMQDFKTDVQMQMQSMHMEIIRQFHIQQTEIAAMLQQYDTNKQLLDIIKDLREENERLRKLY